MQDPQNPFSNSEIQQAGGQPYSNDHYEMMQMRLAMRDSEHLNLMAILHYVWAGLVGLGGIICISYMFMFGAFFKEAMKSIPPTFSSSAPASPSTTSGPVKVLPVSPDTTSLAPAGTSTSSSSPSTSTTYTTVSTAGMVDSAVKMMYIFYGTLAGLCLIGCICNVLSARFMQKRKHRVFSMVVGAINVLMIPLGTILGIFTFIVLCRQNVTQMYTPTDILMQRDPR